VALCPWITFLWQQVVHKHCCITILTLFQFTQEMYSCYLHFSVAALCIKTRQSIQLTGTSGRRNCKGNNPDYKLLPYNDQTLNSQVAFTPRYLFRLVRSPNYKAY
jgi:hypothetical protein